MHEYSIVGALVDRVASEAERAGAARVTALTVRLGEESGVDAGLLATAFDTFKERTVCREAALTIVSSPIAWACPRCKKSIARGEILSCNECGVPAKLQSGDEIILERIEMEVPDV